MIKHIKALWFVFTLFLVFCMTACAANDGRFDVKRSDGEKLPLRLMDVWQDDVQNVMVTLAGTNKGKLLDVAATSAGRYPMPTVQVRILADGQWIESTDYPDGMFLNHTENNGLLTVRFQTAQMPEQIDVSGTVLNLDTLKLPGVDRASLLSAEKEEIKKAEERERQKAEAAEQVLAQATVVAPKAELDTAWIASELLDSGESVYYACTGLEKADAVGVSFILSADKKSVRDIRAQVSNAQSSSTFQVRMDYTSKMQYRLENDRLSVNTGEVYLDVTLDGDVAVGAFGYSIESGKSVFGTSYESCGTAWVEMVKMR